MQYSAKISKNCLTFSYIHLQLRIKMVLLAPQLLQYLSLLLMQPRTMDDAYHKQQLQKNIHKIIT